MSINQLHSCLFGMQMSFRLSGHSNIEIALELATGTKMVPKVTDLHVSGVARIILAPLLPEIPGFGAMVFSLKCATARSKSTLADKAGSTNSMNSMSGRGCTAMQSVPEDDITNVTALRMPVDCLKLPLIQAQLSAACLRAFNQFCTCVQYWKHYWFVH